MVCMTAVDTARARSRAFWGDARFFLGILLVVASVAGVWFVVSASRQTAPGLRREPHDRAGRGDLRRRRARSSTCRSVRSATPTSPPTRSPTGSSRPARSSPASSCPRSAVGDAAAVRTTSVVLRSAVDVPGSVEAGLGRRGLGGAAARARQLRRAPHPGRRRDRRLGDAGRLDDRRRLGRARARDPASGCRRHPRRDGRRVGALGRADRGGGAREGRSSRWTNRTAATSRTASSAEGIAVVAVVAASALALAAEDAALGAEAERMLRGARRRRCGRARGDPRHAHRRRRGALRPRAVRGSCRCAQDASDERIAAAFGLEPPLPLDVEAWQLAERARAARRARRARPVPAADAGPPRIIAVWGPAGAPGRSTVAIELAVELARGGRHVGLVDADTHAPSIALALGLADEGPGFAAACRQAELGGLDARELTRISAPLGAHAASMCSPGLNRPSRWPELSESRVAGGARGVPRVGRPHRGRCRGVARARRGDHERPRRSAPQRRDAGRAAQRGPRRRRRRRRSARHLPLPARATPSCARRSARRRSRSSRTASAPARSASTPAARCAARSSASAESTTSGSCRRTPGQRMPRSWRRARSPMSRRGRRSRWRCVGSSGRPSAPAAGSQRARRLAGRAAEAPRRARRRPPRRLSWRGVDAQRSRLRPGPVEREPMSSGSTASPATGSCSPTSRSPTS